MSDNQALHHTHLPDVETPPMKWGCDFRGRPLQIHEKVRDHGSRYSGTCHFCGDHMGPYDQVDYQQESPICSTCYEYRHGNSYPGPRRVRRKLWVTDILLDTVEVPLDAGVHEAVEGNLRTAREKRTSKLLPKTILSLTREEKDRILATPLEWEDHVELRRIEELRLASPDYNFTHNEKTFLCFMFANMSYETYVTVAGEPELVNMNVVVPTKRVIDVQRLYTRHRITTSVGKVVKAGRPQGLGQVEESATLMTIGNPSNPMVNRGNYSVKTDKKKCLTKSRRHDRIRALKI